MTEQNHHDPAELDKLAEKFTVLPNDNPASDAKRAELIDKPAFGQVFSDNMAHMTWTKGEGWSDRRIEPYAPLKMDPGASVLHYAQECFEGSKVFAKDVVLPEGVVLDVEDPEESVVTVEVPEDAAPVEAAPAADAAAAPAADAE